MQKKNATRKKRTGLPRMNGGTTLIELLVYIALSVGLLTGVGVITISALDAKTKTEAMKSVLSGAIFSEDMLRDTFTRSGSLISPLPATASSGALFLPAASGIAELVATSGDRLILRTEGGSMRYISPPDVRIERLEFFAVGNSATSTGIRVSVSLAAAQKGLWQSFQFRESFISTFLFGPQ